MKLFNYEKLWKVLPDKTVRYWINGGFVLITRSLDVTDHMITSGSVSSYSNFCSVLALDGKQGDPSIADSIRTINGHGSASVSFIVEHICSDIAPFRGKGNIDRALANLNRLHKIVGA